MTARLIAIEGIDGSGKGTLAGNLTGMLREYGLTVASRRFPRYDSAPFGTLIADYLNGNSFGLGDNVYAVATLFALDRRDGLEELQDLCAENDVVVLDRYMASNIAYQCGRLSADPADAAAAALADWIIDYETVRLGQPVPDLTFHLRTTVDMSSAMVAQKGARDYTDLTHDRNESDTDLLGAAACWYAYLCDTETRLGPWTGLEVGDGKGGMRSPNTIATEAASYVYKVLATLK